MPSKSSAARRPQSDSGIAQVRLFPVEDCSHLRRSPGAEHDVAEVDVAVDEHRRWTVGSLTLERFAQAPDVGQVVDAERFQTLGDFGSFSNCWS